jgi:hypothetical protein
VLWLGFHVDVGSDADGAHADRFRAGLVPLPRRYVEPFSLGWWNLGAAHAGADTVDEIPPGAPGLCAGHLLFQHGGNEGLPHAIGGAKTDALRALDQPGDNLVFRCERFGFVVGAQQAWQAIEQPLGTVTVGPADDGPIFA